MVDTKVESYKNIPLSIVKDVDVYLFSPNTLTFSGTCFIVSAYKVISNLTKDKQDKQDEQKQSTTIFIGSD